MSLVRAFFVGFAVLALLLAALSVAVTKPIRARLVDEHGAPLADAFAVYHIKGYRLNFVDSITFNKGGGIVRADEAGRIEIPRRVVMRRPYPLDLKIAPVVDLLYSPGQHNALGSVGSATIAGVIERSADGDIVLYDQGADPNQWLRSMEKLYRVLDRQVRQGVYLGGGQYVALDAALEDKRELLSHMGREHHAFLDRYESTPRTIPPPRHRLTQERHAEYVRAYQRSIEQEPLWGPYLRRRWERRIQSLAGETASH